MFYTDQHTHNSSLRSKTTQKNNMPTKRPLGLGAVPNRYMEEDADKKMEGEFRLLCIFGTK